MAYADDFLELGIAEGFGVTQLLDDLMCDLDSHGGLHDFDGVWMGRSTNTETVVGQCCVTCFGGCVLVGVGSRVEVPVRFIKTNAVGEELDGAVGG